MGTAWMLGGCKACILVSGETGLAADSIRRFSILNETWKPQSRLSADFVVLAVKLSIGSSTNMWHWSLP